MNKKLSLAVAGAVLAFGASAANAGITIPAGDWTVDIGGNVNAYYTHTNYSGALNVPGVSNTSNVVQTGLLPSALGIGAKTRQNDLDIAFQFTFFTGVDSGAAGSSALGGFNGGGNVLGAANGAAGANTLNVRQAYLTFGDASWGTIKGGRDLGIFGSDAILSDMTLLGVGVGAGAGGSSTLGRIGSGYIYADWVGQISYTSPDWNGFQFSAGIREPWTNGFTGSNSTRRADLGYEGKVTYSWTGDYAGKVWLGGITQKHSADSGSLIDYTSRGIDIGAKVSVAGFGLVGYYYDGEGLDSQNIGTGGLPFLGGAKTDDRGGYVQGTYVIPGVGTKLGASWGTSKSKLDNAFDFENKSWIIGAYHPLTKSLNLVAEYTDQKIEENLSSTEGKARTVSLGAILFF